MMQLPDTLRAQILGGSLADHKNHYAGFYRGFYTTMTLDNANFYITVNASKESDTYNADLKTLFLDKAQRDSKNHILSIDVYPHRFTVTIREPNLRKNSAERIGSVMEPIFNYLTINGYESGCGHCGSTVEDVSCWQVDNRILYVNDGCALELENELKNTQSEIKSQKSNLLPGLVGAFLGALIGCIVWIIIGKLGYISGIAGFVMAICAMKGYEMLGKHLDKKGVIVCTITLLVMVYFATKLTWSLVFFGELKAYDWSFSEIFQQFYYILTESEIKGAFFKELGVGYFLTILATVVYIVRAFKNSTGSYRIRKVQ